MEKLLAVLWVDQRVSVQFLVNSVSQIVHSITSRYYELYATVQISMLNCPKPAKKAFCVLVGNFVGLSVHYMSYIVNNSFPIKSPS